MKWHKVKVTTLNSNNTIQYEFTAEKNKHFRVIFSNEVGYDIVN